MQTPSCGLIYLIYTSYNSRACSSVCCVLLRLEENAATDDQTQLRPPFLDSYVHITSHVFTCKLSFIIYAPPSTINAPKNRNDKRRKIERQANMKTPNPWVSQGKKKEIEISREASINKIMKHERMMQKKSSRSLKKGHEDDERDMQNQKREISPERSLTERKEKRGK